MFNLVKFGAIDHEARKSFFVQALAPLALALAKTTGRRACVCITTRTTSRLL
jgi:hypothetical protein